MILAQTTAITVDFSTVAAGLITASLIALATMMVKNNKLLTKVVFQIGNSHPPDGILGRLNKTENELTELREWALSVGFGSKRHVVIPGENK